MRTLAVETARTLPRLARLGQINDHTRISLGRIIAEQAHEAPTGEFLLFDGRVHTYEAVNRRIDNVVRGLISVGVRQGEHVGVLMETRPSALVAIAALSRLGAVAVLLHPDTDLAAEVRLGGVSEIITDPANLEIARQLPEQILVLGGGESRDLHLPDDANVIDMEKIDPDAVALPAWYRPNPGYARDLAFIGFSSASGQLVAKQITNYRWALSAFGTASAAALGRTDTVYCLTPLHHESGLLVSLGGAVVGGTRIALSRGLKPDRFVAELHQYGVTVVSYTWAMLRDVIDDPGFNLRGNHPVRVFIGSGMPTGLWQRVVDVFAPAHVVEFFATTDGHAVLANVSGAKIGSKGRPLPGAGRVELGAYDTDHDLILEDETGLVRVPDTNEVGVLLAEPRGPIDPSASIKRGVFAPADTWISTEYLFRRDAEGDFWLVGRRGTTMQHRARHGVLRAGHRCVRAHSGGRPRRHLRGVGGRPPGRGGRIDDAAGCDDHRRGSHRSRRRHAVRAWPRHRACRPATAAQRNLSSDGQRVACRRDTEGRPACLGVRRRREPVPTVDRPSPGGVVR